MRDRDLMPDSDRIAVRAHRNPTLARPRPHRRGVITGRTDRLRNGAWSRPGGRSRPNVTWIPIVVSPLKTARRVSSATGERSVSWDRGLLGLEAPPQDHGAPASTDHQRTTGSSTRRLSSLWSQPSVRFTMLDDPAGSGPHNRQGSSSASVVMSAEKAVGRAS